MIDDHHLLIKPLYDQNFLNFGLKLNLLSPYVRHNLLNNVNFLVTKFLRYDLLIKIILFYKKQYIPADALAKI